MAALASGGAPDLWLQLPHCTFPGRTSNRRLSDVFGARKPLIAHGHVGRLEGVTQLLYDLGTRERLVRHDVDNREPCLGKRANAGVTASHNGNPESLTRRHEPMQMHVQRCTAECLDTLTQRAFDMLLVIETPSSVKIDDQMGTCKPNAVAFASEAIPVEMRYVSAASMIFLLGGA